MAFFIVALFVTGSFGKALAISIIGHIIKCATSEKYKEYAQKNGTY